MIFFQACNSSFSEKAKDIIGIDTLSNVEILDEGEIKEPSIAYIVFQVEKKEELYFLIDNYQKIPAGVKSKKIDKSISYPLKYINFKEKYYRQAFKNKSEFQEVFIQNNIIIFILTYSN